MFDPWNKKKRHKQETNGNRDKYYMNIHWLVKEITEIKTKNKTNAQQQINKVILTHGIRKNIIKKQQKEIETKIV